MFVDENKNDRWDTGDYASGRQPEAVYYYNEPVERKAKWDDALNWDPTKLPLNVQKPSKLKKQTSSTKKRIQNRNADRARRLGIQYDPEVDQ